MFNCHQALNPGTLSQQRISYNVQILELYWLSGSSQHAQYSCECLEKLVLLYTHIFTQLTFSCSMLPVIYSLTKIFSVSNPILRQCSELIISCWVARLPKVQMTSRMVCRSYSFDAPTPHRTPHVLMSGPALRAEIESEVMQAIHMVS